MREKAHFIGLKKFRERMKLKQYELAKELGQSPSSYHHWETGRYEVSFAVIQRLFELGATVEELFDVPYSSKPVRTELKVSKEEAMEIVKVGIHGLIGPIGLVKNKDVLGNGGGA